MFAFSQKELKHKSTFSDYIGISSAFICLAHCLATPLLIGLGVSTHGHGEGSLLLSHQWDYLFLAIGFGAVWFSSRHTDSFWLRALLWVSFLFLAGVILLEEHTAIFQYLAYGAAISLIIAHLINLLKAIRSGSVM